METNKNEETMFTKTDNAMNFFFMRDEYYALSDDDKCRVMVGMVDFATNQVTKITERSE